MTPQEEVAPLADVPVDIEVELDRRIISAREVLRLETGCVIGTSQIQCAQCPQSDQISLLERNLAVLFGR